MVHENGGWMNEDQKSATKAGSLFPIMGEHKINGRKRCYVPMAIMRRHEAQTKRNHYQTLERLRERGGLSAQEAMAVVADEDWEKRSHKDEDSAWDELQRIVLAEFPGFDCETGEW
jgi:hypothetical protein